MNLQKMAAMPIEITAEGKTYKISPLSLADWAEMERWAEAEMLADAEARAKRMGAEGDALLKEIKNYTSPEMHRAATAYMDSTAASIHRLWLQLRHCHPEILEKDVGNLVSFNQFIEISRRLMPELEKGAAGNPTPDN